MPVRKKVITELQLGLTLDLDIGEHSNIYKQNIITVEYFLERFKEYTDKAREIIKNKNLPPGELIIELGRNWDDEYEGCIEFSYIYLREETDKEFSKRVEKEKKLREKKKTQLLQQEARDLETVYSLLRKHGKLNSAIIEALE